MSDPSAVDPAQQRQIAGLRNNAAIFLDAGVNTRTGAENAPDPASVNSATLAAAGTTLEEYTAVLPVIQAIAAVLTDEQVAILRAFAS